MIEWGGPLPSGVCRDLLNCVFLGVLRVSPPAGGRCGGLFIAYENRKC